MESFANENKANTHNVQLVMKVNIKSTLEILLLLTGQFICLQLCERNVLSTLWDHCFGLPVADALGFKAGVD